MSNFGQQYMPNNMNYAPQDPTAMYQQRLSNMAQQVMNQGQPNMMNYGYQPMQNPLAAMGAMLNQQQAQSFNVRAVTGREEALASQIPLDGSISVFTDFSHNKIYTKQLNMNDGTALMKTFQQVDIPAQEQGVEKPVEYVKKSEFDELKARFDEVWTALTATGESATKQSEKKEGKK